MPSPRPATASPSALPMGILISSSLPLCLPAFPALLRESLYPGTPNKIVLEQKPNRDHLQQMKLGPIGYAEGDQDGDGGDPPHAKGEEADID